jgi:hypothetical protein
MNRDARELVDTLQRDWTQLLHERIAQLSRDPRRSQLPPATIARVAWAETAQRNPELRRMLDAHPDLIDPAARRREEMLIAAGVAVA